MAMGAWQRSVLGGFYAAAGATKTTCANPSSSFRYLCEALSALNQRCPELAPRAPVRHSYVGGVDAATCRGVRNELHGLLRPNLAGKEWRTPVPEVSGISSVGSGEAL